MRGRKTLEGTGAGVAASAVFGVAGLPPAAALAAGAVAIVVALRRTDPVRPYAIAGTTWALGFGVLIAVVPVFPEPYGQTALLSLLLIGAMSAVVVTGRELLKWVLKTVITKATGSVGTGEAAGRTVSAVVGTVVLAWSVVRAKERIARSAVVGIFGPVSFLLELVGLKATIPFFLVEGLNLTLFTLVGCLLVGFHTLASWHAAILLKDDENVRAAGRAVKEGASTAGERTVETAGEARDTLAATLANARDRVEDDGSATEGAG